MENMTETSGKREKKQRPSKTALLICTILHSSSQHTQRDILYQCLCSHKKWSHLSMEMTVSPALVTTVT